MSKRAFSRCNSGHYFIGENCPIDGWSSAATKELTVAQKRLARTGEEVSMRALRKLGVSEATLARAIVIEFGSDACVFEAFGPEFYGINGEMVSMENLDDNFL